jgi:protein-S-isoprenylcysteine O-methyltransferase Ste14
MVHILGRLNRIVAIRFAHPMLGYVGLLLILEGIVVRWTAIVTLGKHFTVDVSIVKGHKIVDHGIYRHLRHPTYAGLLLSFFGFAVAYENWISFLVIFPPILAAYLYGITVDEKALVAHFEAAYNKYAKRTKRLIPYFSGGAVRAERQRGGFRRLCLKQFLSRSNTAPLASPKELETTS